MKHPWFLLASARFRHPLQYVCPQGNDTGSWYNLGVPKREASRDATGAARNLVEKTHGG